MFKRSGSKAHSLVPVYRTPFHFIQDSYLDSRRSDSATRQEPIIVPAYFPVRGEASSPAEDEEPGVCEYPDDSEPIADCDQIEESDDIDASPDEETEEPIPSEEAGPAGNEGTFSVPESVAVTVELEGSYPADTILANDHPGHHYPRTETRTTWKDSSSGLVSSKLLSSTVKGLVSMVKEVQMWPLTRLQLFH